MPLGPRDLSNLQLHVGWDAEELKNFELADGTTFAQVAQRLNTALGAINSEMFAHPVYRNAVSYTTRPEVSYRQGSGNGFEDFTEYSRPDEQRSDRTGHMLPLKPKDRALGWTWSYLKEARLEEIDDDIRDAVDDVRNLWRVELLTRALKQGDDSGANKGLGSTGLSPGFATDAANTGVDFKPPDNGGRQFTTSHEHYVAVSGGWAASVFEDIRDELREHGHEPPYEVWIADVDQATVEGLTGFVPAAEALISYGDNQDLANVDRTQFQGSYIIGVLKDCVIRVVPGMPQYYGFGFKSYGPNSQRNPLRIRLERGASRPQVIAMPHPNSGSGAVPLSYTMLYIELGVGVGPDRTVATPRYVNSATWTDGSPS